MKIDEFIKKIKELGILVDQEKLNLLEKYCLFLQEYNKHTNITSITDTKEIYLKHFYDSLTIYNVEKFSKETSVIDIGSGAGFPGIVLKIFFPNIKLTVLDSNNKKTKFMTELTNKLGLKDITIINDRAENFAKTNLNKYDICTSRAVAFIDIVSELCLPFIKKEGKVILMKGSFDEEKLILQKYYKQLNIKEYKIFNCNLDFNNIRNLVILTKENDTINVKEYNTILNRNKKWKKELIIN